MSTSILRAHFGLRAFVLSAALAMQAAPPSDPFMGDWEGTLRTGGGTKPVAAQVIALGKGRYRVNLLDALYRGLEPKAVLEGALEKNVLRFGAAAQISGGVFQGVLPGGDGGTFEMKHVEKLSPTLGDPPPTGAVVLLDGTSLDQWEQPGKAYGVADLNKTLGHSRNCVGYLRNAIRSDRERTVRLDIGSDDGVKVWLNGETVHTANVFRPLTPGQDRVQATLKPGWNEVLMKVSQGGGDWGGWLRVTGEDGNPISGLSVRHAARAADGTVLSVLGARVNGIVLCWQAAGPFRKEGIAPTQLLDTPFPPETAPESVAWKLLGREESPPGPRWKLLEDGAVEIVPGTGSLITKKKFGDFRLHLEFRTPFMPEARGQARGNSGVYLQARYEIQVLDSYGLKGLDNECGGIYKVARPRINMCAPPLQWQTYDIEFHAPRFGADGRKNADAWVTVRHNGVVIHEKQPIPHPTGGGNGQESAEPGPILLQDHHNRVRYRNIWVLPLN